MIPAWRFTLWAGTIGLFGSVQWWVVQEQPVHAVVLAVVSLGLWAASEQMIGAAPSGVEA